MGRKSKGVAREPAHLTAKHSQVVAFVVRGECAESELTHQREHPILGGTNPLTTEFDNRSIVKGVIEDTTPDTIPGFENYRLNAGSHEAACSSETCQTCTHDNDAHWIGPSSLATSVTPGRRELRSEATGLASKSIRKRVVRLAEHVIHKA